MPSSLSNGKICYIVIPATDLEKSAAFYESIFGWTVRRRPDGRITFTDTSGELGGAWETGRKPSTEPGVLLYVMVRNVEAATRSVVNFGGEIVQPVTPGRETTATFRDPGGNVVGLYQEG